MKVNIQGQTVADMKSCFPDDNMTMISSATAISSHLSKSHLSF